MTFPDLAFITIWDLEQCMKRTHTPTLTLRITSWVPSQNFPKGWFVLHYHCLQSTHSRAQLSQSHTVTENIFSKNLNQAFRRKLIVKKNDEQGRWWKRSMEISRRWQMLPKATHIHYVPLDTWHCEVNLKWQVFSHCSTGRSVNWGWIQTRLLISSKCICSAWFLCTRKGGGGSSQWVAVFSHHASL